MTVKEKIITGLYASIGPIGALHSSAANKIYSSPEIANFMSGYQHDITAPFGVYFFTKFVQKESMAWPAAAIFAIYSLGEIAQGLNLYPGTYDPKDFIAFAAGTGLAIFVDKLTFKNKKLESIITE